MTDTQKDAIVAAAKRLDSVMRGDSTVVRAYAGVPLCELDALLAAVRAAEQRWAAQGIVVCGGEDDDLDLFKVSMMSRPERGRHIAKRIARLLNEDDARKAGTP